MAENACLACGACCAAFRVHFHRADLESGDGRGVPAEMAVPVIGSLWRMRGTDEAAPRCIALVGEVGNAAVGARCSIYARRPGPCRDFAPYAPLGIGDDACDRARRRHGLEPLQLSGSV